MSLRRKQLRAHAEQKRGVDAARLEIVDNGEVSPGLMGASVMVSPSKRHGFLQWWLAKHMFSGEGIADTKMVDISKVLELVWEQKLEIDGADVHLQALFCQAMTMDTLMTDLLRRAALADDLDVYERFLRLAIKAQSASRTTVETLDRIMRGGEQVVRHVHVNEGGQAVIAGTFNHESHSSEGNQNSNLEDQYHEPGGTTESSASLPCENTPRHALPVPDHQRSKEMPTPRRPGRRSKG